MLKQILLILTVQSCVVWAGGEVTNGGDAVFCIPHSSSPYSGYYSLDYLLTKDSASEQELLTGSWSEIFDEIAQQLATKFPPLGRDLKAFKKRVYADDFSSPYIWKKATFGLIDIKDEMIIEKLPLNCYEKFDDSTIRIFQAVIREPRSSSTIYNYDPEIIKQLENVEYQLSFLLLHEWLWSYSDDVRVIRDANRLLHSAEIKTLSSFELSKRLKILGLNLPELQPGDRTTATVETKPWGYIPENTLRFDPNRPAFVTVSNKSPYKAIVFDQGLDSQVQQLEVPPYSSLTLEVAVPHTLPIYVEGKTSYFIRIEPW